MDDLLLLEDSSSCSTTFEMSYSSSTSSSSTSTSSEDETDKTARVENFLQIIIRYTDLQFKQHFRVSRSVALKLIDLYKLHSQKDRRYGRPIVGPDLEIYIFIWYISNTETYRQISDRFNITKSSVFRILHRTVKWIVLISNNVIKWPNNTEMEQNQQQFKNFKNFPRVVGAIDGTHIRINAPKADRKAYYNRKKYYSILLQGIVDPKKNFIDVYCGEPGSMHDARVFRRSGFFSEITQRPNLIIPGGILLGDSAYPASNFLVTPYKDFGNSTAKQRKFNYLHSATRVVVEQAFGLLKCRFRRLKFFESPDVGFIVHCVTAACVLHNLCIQNNDEIVLEEITIENGSNLDTNDEPENRNQIRDEIFRELDNLNLLN